jgi:putative transposase
MSRTKKASFAFIKKALRCKGTVETITTDRLRSYRAAMDERGIREKQEIGRWANNSLMKSYLLFSRLWPKCGPFQPGFSVQEFLRR